MPVKSVSIVVKGRVQGVGFRYFAQYRAEQLNITGWVRNTPDGNVEIEATGEPENMNAFIDRIKIGPSRSIVQSISVSEFTPTRTFTNFTIR
ncbi:MAG: acylphosphatase [Prolixibacteraceae bacterium]|jgi:acylphosphatase